MIVVDFAVGLIYIPVFEGGIGPSGIGAGIHAIFRIGLIIEILDARIRLRTSRNSDRKFPAHAFSLPISWNRCP